MPLTDNETVPLTDREFLEVLADRVEQFIADTERRLDHADLLAHETSQKVTEIAAFIDEHRPALAKGLALMGGGLGGWIGKKGKTGG